MNFFAELQRRHVYKVGAMYAVAGWLLVQVITQVFPIYEISTHAQRVFVGVIIAGFPLALVLAWLFDITPAGIVRTEDAPARGESAETVGERRSVDRRLNYVLGALVLIGFVYFIAERLLPGPQAASARVAPDDKSIAVLPFENLSDDHANAYFAGGMQDEILTRLAGIADLRVISRTSTAKYASRPDNLKTVAAELGVTTVLEGSVQKSGEAVRINVQLIDARTDRHLWAQTYDRDLKNVFAVESDVSQDIAAALQAKLTASESHALAQAPTQNAAAYDLFLKGEYEFNRAKDATPDAKANFSRARADYRQAIALDDHFALAHAELAISMLVQHWLDHSLSEAELAEAKSAGKRALALAPDLPEAHLAVGYDLYYAEFDFPAALSEFQQALALAPGSQAAAIAVARIQRRLGQWPQALASFEQALRIAPRSSEVLGDYGETLLFLRRFPEAEAALLRAQALDPDDAYAMNNVFLTRLGGKGDLAGARAAITRLADRINVNLGIPGDALTVVSLPIYPLVIEHRYAEALQAWDALRPDTINQQLQGLAARAVIAVISGQQREHLAACRELKSRAEPEIKRFPENPELPSWLGWGELCLGHPAEAMKQAQRASDLQPLSKDFYAASGYLAGKAQIAALAGQPDEALRLIAQLLARPAGFVITIERLKLDPVWDVLRKDPRFQKLITDGEAAPQGASAT